MPLDQKQIQSGAFMGHMKGGSRLLRDPPINGLFLKDLPDDQGYELPAAKELTIELFMGQGNGLVLPDG